MSNPRVFYVAHPEGVYRIECKKPIRKIEIFGSPSWGALEYSLSSIEELNKVVSDSGIPMSAQTRRSLLVRSGENRQVAHASHKVERGDLFANVLSIRKLSYPKAGKMIKTLSTYLEAKTDSERDATIKSFEIRHVTGAAYDLLYPADLTIPGETEETIAENEVITFPEYKEGDSFTLVSLFGNVIRLHDIKNRNEKLPLVAVVVEGDRFIYLSVSRGRVGGLYLRPDATRIHMHSVPPARAFGKFPIDDICTIDSEVELFVECDAASMMDVMQQIPVEKMTCSVARFNDVRLIMARKVNAPVKQFFTGFIPRSDYELINGVVHISKSKKKKRSIFTEDSYTLENFLIKFQFGHSLMPIGVSITILSPEDLAHKMSNAAERDSIPEKAIPLDDKKTFYYSFGRFLRRSKA